MVRGRAAGVRPVTLARPGVRGGGDGRRVHHGHADRGDGGVRQVVRGQDEASTLSEKAGILRS